MSLPKNCQHEAVAGFFFQSDPATDAAVLDYVSKQASVRSKLVIEALSRMVSRLVVPESLLRLRQKTWA